VTHGVAEFVQQSCAGVFGAAYVAVGEQVGLGFGGKRGGLTGRAGGDGHWELRCFIGACDV